MPSTGRVQLNLSVEPEIKESLRKHCEAAGLSFAQAITEYVKACDREGRLLISNIPNAIPNIDPDSVVTFDKLPSALDSYFSQSDNELATQDYVQQAIANLREELKVITHDLSELPTITKVNSKSLAPLFEDEEGEEEDADWNKLKVTELRRVITIKGLGKKFREKLGKSPREAKKAEIIKFLQSTSIFDYD